MEIKSVVMVWTLIIMRIWIFVGGVYSAILAEQMSVLLVSGGPQFELMLRGTIFITATTFILYLLLGLFWDLRWYERKRALDDNVLKTAIGRSSEALGSAWVFLMLYLLTGVELLMFITAIIFLVGSVAVTISDMKKLRLLREASISREG